MKISKKTLFSVILLLLIINIFLIKTRTHEGEVFEKSFVLLIILALGMIWLSYKNNNFQQTNKILHNIVNNIQGVVIEATYDADFTINYANTAFFKMIGWTKEEFSKEKNNRFIELVPENEKKEFLKQKEVKLVFNSTVNLEYNLMRKDGEIIHIIDQSVFVKNSIGNIQVYSTLTEVTNNQTAISALVSLISRNLELENITENIDIGFAKLALEPQIKLQYLNKKASAYLGYSKDEFGKQTMVSLLGIKETLKILKKICLLKNKNEAIDLETKALHKDGQEIYFSIKINKILDAFGKKTAIVIFQDITEDKKTRENLILSERRFQIAIDNSEAIIFDYIPREKKIIHSEIAVELYGVDEVMDNFPESWLEKKIIAPESEACFLKAFKNIENGAIKSNVIIKTFDKAGDVKWQEVTIVNVFVDGDTEAVRAVGIMHDITEVKEQELQLQHLARIDQLTSMYNKVSTKHLIETELKKNNEQGQHALFLIDLDNFKEVNDKFGHACGDKVLVELSEIIKHSFRDNDIVGRIGGDEFMVLFKNFANKKNVEDKMQRLTTELYRTFNWDSKQLRVSASIGVAIYPDDGGSFEELYKKADLAMYSVKGTGKKGFEFYQDPLSIKASFK